jgi:hypothetical protein
MEGIRAKEKEPANCTENSTWPEGQVKKESRISGLQVMGVFTLYGLLASLVWGVVTSVLVITSKVWSAEKPVSSMDVSTSMRELKPEGSDAGPKPAALSFRGERVRLEWARRGCPQGGSRGGLPGEARKKARPKRRVIGKSRPAGGVFPT